MGVMHGDEAVRIWRADVGAGALCMHGTTASYAVDPAGEYVVGMVLAGGMRVRRGHEVHRFAPGDVCAWDPSARHEGRPWRSERWQARLVVLELPDVRELVLDPDGAGGDVVLASPRVRDPGLARRFLALHAALEGPAWRLERDTLLQEWLCALAGPTAGGTTPPPPPRGPAPRRAPRPGAPARVRAHGRRPRAQPRARRGRDGGRGQPPPLDAALPRRLRPTAAPLRARPAHPHRPAAARGRGGAGRRRRADRLLRPEPPAPSLHAHPRDDARGVCRRAALRRTRRGRPRPLACAA